MCSNQLYQLSSSSHSIYMESLNSSKLPLKGMKGRPYAYDDEALSVGFKKESGSLHDEDADKPVEAVIKEVGSNYYDEALSADLKIEADTPDEASINEVAKMSKQRSREKEKLEQEKEDAIEKMKKEILDEDAKMAAARRVAARLRRAEQRERDKEKTEQVAVTRREASRFRTAKCRAKKKLEQEYQESTEDRLSDDDFDNDSVEDLKKEMEEDDILDEATRKAVARREAARLCKARQRARDKEKLEQELVSLDHEVPETALVRKALIKEIEDYPRLWNRTISPKGAKSHDWRQILERLQVTFESNPGLLVRCRANSADKLRHIWYRLYEQHNLTWKKNGWKESGMLYILHLMTSLIYNILCR